MVTTSGVPLASSTCHIRPFPGKFPPELVDAVIDQLHGDTDSLGACALTSSSWLSTSRYHFFSDVCFKNGVYIIRWVQMFPAPSNIPAYVENLHIGCVSLLDDPPNATLDFSTFTSLKGLFIGGKEVGSAWYRRPDWSCLRRIVLLPSTTLRTFSFSSPIIPACDIFSVIRHFPRLDNLHLRCFAALSSGHSEDTETDISPSFRGALTLASHISYGPLVTNLLGFPGRLHFSSLNFTILRDDELPNLRALVDMSSYTITSLHFTIDPFMVDDESSYLFDLSECHQLSEIHITLHAMRFPAKQLVKMLSSVVGARPLLRDLSLRLFTWRSWNFMGRDVDRWDAVDMALVELSQVIRDRSGTDPSIQVIVNLLGYGPHNLRDILPRLGEKGLVRLMRDGDSTSELS